MIAEDRDVGVPGEEGIVGRKVVGPKEGLVTQLDGRREEVEECDEHRPLDEHRQTAARGANTHLAVERHHLLLLLHGIGLVGVLLVEGLHFGHLVGDTHTSRRFVRLVGHRQGDELDEEGHQEDDDAVGRDELVHEVEQWDDDPRVDVVDDETPAEVERILEVEVLVLLADEAGSQVVHVVELPVVLRADVEAHRDGLRGSLGVEFELKVLGSIALDDVGVFLLLDGFAGETACSKEVVGDEHGGEELVLERYPAHTAIEGLIVA